MPSAAADRDSGGSTPGGAAAEPLSPALVQSLAKADAAKAEWERGLPALKRAWVPVLREWARAPPVVPPAAAPLAAKGVPPALRGAVWYRAVGNSLLVTGELYDACLTRARALHGALATLAALEEDEEAHRRAQAQQQLQALTAAGLPRGAAKSASAFSPLAGSAAAAAEGDCDSDSDDTPIGGAASAVPPAAGGTRGTFLDRLSAEAAMTAAAVAGGKDAPSSTRTRQFRFSPARGGGKAGRSAARGGGGADSDDDAGGGGAASPGRAAGRSAAKAGVSTGAATSPQRAGGLLRRMFSSSSKSAMERGAADAAATAAATRDNDADSDADSDDSGGAASRAVRRALGLGDDIAIGTGDDDEDDEAGGGGPAGGALDDDDDRVVVIKAPPPSLPPSSPSPPPPNPLSSGVGHEASVSSIGLDVRRTFPELAFFGPGSTYRSQLAHVLLAYAAYRPDHGYVQGMSHVAGLALLTIGVRAAAAAAAAAPAAAATPQESSAGGSGSAWSGSTAGFTPIAQDGAGGAAAAPSAATAAAVVASQPRSTPTSPLPPPPPAQAARSTSSPTSPYSANSHMRRYTGGGSGGGGGGSSSGSGGPAPGSSSASAAASLFMPASPSAAPLAATATVDYGSGGRSQGAALAAAQAAVGRRYGGHHGGSGSSGAHHVEAGGGSGKAAAGAAPAPPSPPSSSKAATPTAAAAAAGCSSPGGGGGGGGGGEPRSPSPPVVYVPSSSRRGQGMAALDKQLAEARQLEALAAQLMPVPPPPSPSPAPAAGAAAAAPDAAASRAAEVAVFTALCNLMARPPLRWLVARSLPSLDGWYAVFTGALARTAPPAAALLAACAVQPSMFLSGWVLTLFTRPLGLQAAARLWDRLLLPVPNEGAGGGLVSVAGGGGVAAAAGGSATGLLVEATRACVAMTALFLQPLTAAGGGKGAAAPLPEEDVMAALRRPHPSLLHEWLVADAVARTRLTPAEVRRLEELAWAQ